MIDIRIKIHFAYSSLLSLVRICEVYQTVLIGQTLVVIALILIFYSRERRTANYYQLN